MRNPDKVPAITTTWADDVRTVVKVVVAVAVVLAMALGFGVYFVMR